MLRTIKRLRRAITYNRIRQVVRTTSVAPPVVGVLILFLLSWPAQMADLYLGLWQDGWELDLPRGAVALTGLLVLSALLGYWHLFLARPRIEEVYVEYPDVGFHRNLSRVALATALGLAALPGLGVLFGLWRAHRLVQVTCVNVDLARTQLLAGAGSRATWLDSLVPDCQSAVLGLRPAVFKLTAIAAIVAIGTVVLLVLLVRWRRRGRPVILLAASALLAVIAVAGPMLAAHAFKEGGMRVIVSLAWLAGPMVALLVVITSAVIVIMGLSWVSQRAKFPVLSFLVLIGVVFAAQGFQGPAPPKPGIAPNVAVETAVPARKSDLDLQSSFLDWLADKKRKSRNPSAPYPVFIFAAEGGGIYAASAIALYLSALQDQCDEFAGHVFAISGVSGGAIGATVFDALLSGKLPTGCDASEKHLDALTVRTDRILRADHLSPLLAFVLPDVVGKDLPIGSGWDRAAALEWSLNCAFEGAHAGAPIGATCRFPASGQGELMHSFDSYWRDRQLAAPALVLNTTWVETGYRVAFAPKGFEFKSIGDGTLMAFSEVFGLTKQQGPETAVDHTRLIEAAVASARFPLIEPPWSPPLPNHTWNFVDGGYVDNSGAATALDLYKALDKLAKDNGANLHLIVLTDKLPALQPDTLDGSGFRDIVAPIAALLNVRAQLSSRALTETEASILARDRLQTREAASIPGRLYVRLDQRDWALPLGWKISKTELDYVRMMLGSPELCQPRNKATADRSTGLVRTIVDNSCVTKWMLDHMRAPVTQ